MKFWHFVKVVRSRLLMILGLVLVTGLVIFLAAPQPTVVYPASAYVSPTPQVMEGGLSTANTNPALGTTANEREVIKSNLIVLASGGEVFLRALDFLAMPVLEQQDACPGLPAYRQISRVEFKPGKLLTMADWRDTCEVSPVRLASVGTAEGGTTTDILEITVKLRDGSIAPFLANAVGYAFSETYLDKSREDLRKNARFLESSLEESRNKLNALQARMTDYKNAHSVLQVDAETQNAIASMATLEAQRAEAQAAVSEAAAALRDANTQLAQQPLVVRNPLPGDMSPEVQKLQSELAQAEADLRVVALTKKPTHSEYMAVQKRVDLLRDKIENASANYAPAKLNDIHDSLLKKRSEAMSNLATARARLGAANASIGQAQSKANNLTRSEPGLSALLREYSQADASYKMFSERLAQAQIAEKEFTKTGSIIPYDWAREARSPIILGASRRSVLVYGLVLALVLGVAIAVWLDSIDTRMRNAADVEKLLALPILGLTPALTGRDGMLPKLTHIYPLSAMAESYRILRTNILFALRDHPFKTLMVATGRPGQGGTTTICNLAIALAQIGKRIILIDADMRRPSLHKFFGIGNEVGLSNILQGSCKLTDAFQKTDIENLIVIPGGPQPLNPSELLGSEKMKGIVAMLQDHCDLVLFDTPSTVVFSDGPMLASWIDAVIMVVSANQAPRGTEAQTRDLLRRANANILGVVVNRMQHDAVDSCYYYSHYYSDSVPGDHKVDVDAIGPGSGGNGSEPKAEAPKAIPAPAPEAEEAKAAAKDEDNPFPD